MSADLVRSTSLVSDAVALILAQAQAAIDRNGLFRLGLCGGGTPKPVYAALAQTPIDWRRVQLTFGDERCVPPDDAQSNYRMVRETLLDPAGIPEGNVFRMEGERDPAEAAARYEERLANVAARMGESRYVHDLLLLGMGDDGHTASLFPETAALEESQRNVMANFVPKFGTHRITFTYPLINAARQVCFLVNDPAKEPILEAVLAGGSGYPAERVAPASGKVQWLVGA
ncbi:MAG TPA: 6-phosphogluconolactonase [Chthoniobacteraceae bacterium]|nr:6-phosphogluconolactonase [Chthoniobacteraceae bacterium]